jgi:S1-C subfamily serine protease
MGALSFAEKFKNENNMNSKKYFIAAVAIVSAVLIAQSGVAQKIIFNNIKPAASTAPLTDEQQGILAVRTAKASVVNIIGVENQATGTESSADPATSASPDEVLGTGFVLDSSGLIVSNNHVVEDPTMNYTVVLGDGSEYPAKILNLDKFDDIALLQISAPNLTPAMLGDSDSLETGQTVFAIGNSLGKYSYTVTRGVVSGLGRNVDVSEDSDRLHNLIQTDASINPGNSGGPLINLAGQVVGMNTLIDTEGSGLGFAIPINTIKDAEMQLKTFGKVSRPYLGVMFLAIDPAAQITQGLSVENGALVMSVKPNSPASAAGLTQGDIIVGINDIVLNQSVSLDDAIGKFQAGSQITLKILRNNQELDIPVVLGELQ